MRWGLQHLSEPERRKARRADEMYLRMMLLMHVATEGRKRMVKTPPWALIENPEDPERYVAEGSRLWEKARELGGFPSFFATKEFRTLARLLGLSLHHGDQGPYGHAKRKPTTWASTKPLPVLMRAPGKGSPDSGEGNLGQMEESERAWQWPSAAWAKWAPGMIELLGNLLDAGGDNRPCVAKVDFDWESHVKNGHWPPSRRCRMCIAASARQRPQDHVPGHHWAILQVRG